MFFLRRRGYRRSPVEISEISAGLTFADAEEITKDFCAEREFAQGPYGRFYWGWTKDGQRVSVLLLGDDMARFKGDELRQELHKLRKLNHPNLARLYGYCCGKFSALCLEDLPDGSLHRRLSDESNGLDWHTRHRIIKGICEAWRYIEPIGYLLPLPNNILLDENMEPKVVGLGFFQTRCGAYDRKYLAPEYADSSAHPKKGCIFSLGVVMMEIMTGPMGHIRISNMAHPQFSDQVQENWRKRMRLTCSGSELELCCQQVKRCIMIALSCQDNDQHKRPNIMEIINKLNETEHNISQIEDDRGNSEMDLGPSPNIREKVRDLQQALASIQAKGLLGNMEQENTSMVKLQDRNHGGQEMPNVSIRQQNRRTEGSSSKQKSSLPTTMDDIYIRELKVLEQTVDRRGPPSNISFALLQLITKNFSDELIIGQGGCGVVYKGILTNRIIAVKKLLSSHTIDDKMFHQEVKSMMMVNQQNTVRFLGYCSHTEERATELKGEVIMAQIRERLLCFEYIGNGSLDSQFTDELRGLEWHTRYKIIQGICEGLQYLHKEKHIIHMDLKPANILLDDQMVPKITDFGLSRLDDKSQTMGAERLFSLGYCAPEYLNCGKRSRKSDIYSLGVIIMELVTGIKRNPCTSKVNRRWKHRWNKSAKDTQLGYQQVAKCLDLAQRCIQMDPMDRPDIWDIVGELIKMDSGEGDISDATEYLELEDMLRIEPLELHLPFELNKQMSCSVELTNDTDDYFAFRISTISLLPYRINPNNDILQPRSKCSVTITLQALEKALLHDQSRDELSVQSARVDESLTAEDITGDLFHQHPGRVVDDVNLVVVLDAPTLPGDG